MKTFGKWMSLLLFLAMAGGLSAQAQLNAYYTRLDYKDKISGRYADVVVEIPETGKLIFSRETSYLPHWQTTSGQWTLDEIVPRHGDGTDKQPDKFNRFSYVRIIERSPQRVVVHWRYYPDFNHLGFTGVAQEVFTIEPDGTITRRIKQGTARYDEWQQPDNMKEQVLQLTANGVKTLSFKEASPQAQTEPPVQGSPVKTDSVAQPVIHFRFDEGLNGQPDATVESVSGLRRPIEGHDSYWVKGISGTALNFDGYFTQVKLAPEQARPVGYETTLEAWVAMAAHPFGWAPIVTQSNWEKSGYYFGIDAFGHLGLMAKIGREWQTLNSEKTISLQQWTHVAATIDYEDEAMMRLFINGQPVAEKAIEGEQTHLANAPLSIGLNTDKLIPLPRQTYRYGQYACITGFEGMIDEVRLYDRSLSPNQLKTSFEQMRPSKEIIENPGFEARKLPAKPGLANAFGADYTNIKYHRTWDSMWRSSPWPDITVGFDQVPNRIVFWRGPSYGPGWVTDNNLWLADQSVETGNAISYCEHMSDKMGYYTHVRLIESNEARAIVHWRYSINDVLYHLLDRYGEAGVWVDEYFTFYPDGVAIRKVNQKSQTFEEDPPTKIAWQDVQFFAEPGMSPTEVMEMKASTLAALDGRSVTLDWSDGVPENTLPEANVQLINFKAKHKVFLAFQEGTYINPWGSVRKDDYCHFMTWNHWPVSLITSQGKSSYFPDRITHSALAAADNVVDHGNMAMYGFTDQAVESLLPLVRSWCRPAAIVNLKGADHAEYNKAARAYEMKANSNDMSFEINATADAPIVNPCFAIANWDNRLPATVEINGEIRDSGPSMRQGIETDANGLPIKVIWLELTSEQPVAFKISKSED